MIASRVSLVTNLLRAPRKRSALAALVAVFGVMAFGTSSASATDVLTQNWEAGLGTWTVGGDFWHVQDSPQNISVKNPEINPTLVTLPDSGSLPSAFDGSKAAWFGDATTGTFCGGFDPATQSPKNGCTSDRAYAGTLTSPSFSLVGATSAIVHFRAWWEIEAVNSDGFDVMKVEYSTDGGTTWNPTGELNPANNPAGSADGSYSNNGLGVSPSWKEYLVDLSPAIGQANVKVRFNFDTVDNLFQGFRGWLVDAIRVATPYDAAPPSIASVQTCAGQQNAPVTIINGQNFVLGSKVIVDGTEASGASVEGSDRIELPALAAGQHTMFVQSPNGQNSNAVLVQAGACAPATQPAKAATGTNVGCNYSFTTFLDTCTAQVGSAGNGPPTGQVSFTTDKGGTFVAGSKCNLATTSTTAASCSVQYQPPCCANAVMTAGYAGDAQHNPSAGATNKLISDGQGTAIASGSINPSAFFAAPSGPSISRTFGAIVKFKLKAPARVVFTVQKPASGRKVKHGKTTTCDPVTRKNRNKSKCSRFVTLKGSFALTPKVGANKFRFRGRIGGKRLKPGSYRLVATPSIAGVPQKATSIRFRIKKP